MKLIYIDESGNTGTRVDDLEQRYHLLVALVVEDIKVREIENEVRLLGLKHFEAHSQNTDFEFHGYQIHKGKGRYFSKLKVEKRIEIMEDLLCVIKNHNLSIICSSIDKIKSKERKLHPHQLAFLFLVERIEDYLAQNDSMGLLIADENDDIEQRLIDDLERFKTLNTDWGWRRTKVEHIIDSIHFVKSNNNHLIQLADVVAFVILRGKKTHEELMERYRNTQAQNWLEWLDANASLKQKTELKHRKIIASCVKNNKEFP